MTFDGWTFGFEVLNFLVLALLLWRFAYRPLLAAIDRRRAATAAQLESAREERSRAEALRRELESEREALAGRRDAALAEARRAADAERERLLAEAREQAAGLVDAGRRRLDGERRTAEGELRRQAGRLAVALARRLLEGAGGAELRRRLAEQALTSLKALSTERREALLASLDQGQAVVATPEALDDAEREALEARLGEALGRPVPLETRVEPGLIEGLELRFPHLALRHSWGHALEQALSEIERDDAAATA